VSPWPILSRPQSMPAPFSAFPSQWYRARVLAEAVQEDHCRGPGASTRQALQYTRPVIPPRAGMTSPAFPIGNMYKCPGARIRQECLALSGAAQASAAFGGTSGALGGIPVTLPDS
jgi:hypothetical protein